MKVMIAGSRRYSCYEEAKAYITDCLSCFPGASFTFLSGGCRGADALGERYAAEHGYPLERCLPQWGKFGRAAGLRRNRQLLERSDAVICFWDGESRGTAHVIACAESLRKTLFIKKIG